MDALIKQLKAGTILETIVALSIVMMTFGIALLIFNTISASSSNHKRLKASLLMSDMAISIKNNQLFERDLENEGILVTFNLDSYENLNDVKLLSMEAKDPSGKMIANRKEIFILK
jgi:hypothetical protein